VYSQPSKLRAAKSLSLVRVLAWRSNESWVREDRVREGWVEARARSLGERPSVLISKFN
jgi:hypothetical protein